MAFLNRIKIPTKIFAGFGIVIGLLLVAAGVGSWSLAGANDDYDEYRALARQTVAVGRVQANMLMTRIHAKDFVIKPNEESISQVKARAEETIRMIDHALKLAIDDKRREIIDALEDDLKSYVAEFQRVTDLQAKRNRLVFENLKVIGANAESALTEITEQAYQKENLQAAYRAGRMLGSVMRARVHAAHFLIQNDEASYKTASDEFATIDKHSTQLTRELKAPQLHRLAGEVTKDVERYRQVLVRVHKITHERNEAIHERLNRIGPVVARKVEKLKLSLKSKQEIVGPLAEAEIDAATEVTIGVSLLAFFLGISSAWVIGNGIARPVVSMTDAMSTLADGDTEITIPATDHRDEIGAMAKAVQVFKENKIRADALAEEERRIQRELADAYGLITQSIDYSSNIQRAILPPVARLEQMFEDHFVHWEPRDVVSGDFYWARDWGDGKLFVLADCTGHGVPGAFMTLVAAGALERAILNLPEGNVGALIQRTHQLVQVALNQQTDEGEADDGLELGAVYVGPTDKPGQSRFIFTGARFDLFIADKDDVEIIKGTKAGLGYRRFPADQEYAEVEIENTSGKSFYLTTDGLIDQLGGEKRRAFGKRRLSALLLEIIDAPFDEQRERIKSAIEVYQGENVRQDDVAIAGFRLG